MLFAKFIASQLRKPKGLFGKYIMTFVLNRSNRLMNERVFHLLQPQPADRILEAGFGGGFLLEKICLSMEQGKVTGIDFSEEIIETGKKKLASFIQAGLLELVRADISELDFDANSFDKICSVNTIYFWPDVMQVLRGLMYVLESKGLLFLCFSTESAMQEFDQITRHGFNIHSVEQVKQFMEKAGFINVRIVPGMSQHGEFVVAVGEKF